MNDGLGKQAEQKIREWLDKPEDGQCFDRIPDQMTGMYLVSRNICDFTCFSSPYYYYIESKATWEDRFNFSMLTDFQYEHMLEKYRIPFVESWVVVLFATYKRAFILPIQEIDKYQKSGRKSINIKKIEKWGLRYVEVETIPNTRKKYLDYTGKINDYRKLLYD